jgi:hypothetical protein
VRIEKVLPLGGIIDPTLNDAGGLSMESIKRILANFFQFG